MVNEFPGGRVRTGGEHNVIPAPLARREWIERLHRRGSGVPYGIALAAAALLVYPHTEWMAALGF